MWRLIRDSSHDAYENMARDEALLLSGTPTLRLYSWSPPAVSIGYFQSYEREADDSVCPVVRRITGGGAVYHDKELTYSFVVPERYVESDIIGSYGQICGAVVRGLKKIGLDARFSPINDILVKGRKISGSAQTRRSGIVLQHGTILLELPDDMFRALRVSAQKIAVKERVTSVARELGSYDIDSMRDAIVGGFTAVFEQKFALQDFTREELAKAEELAVKFRSEKWNRRR
jgi:lipoate---protein ligase